MAAVNLNIGGGSGGTDLIIGSSPLLGMVVITGYPAEVFGLFLGSSPYGEISITGYAAEVERTVIQRDIGSALGEIELSGYPVEFAAISYLAPSILWPSYTFDGTSISISLSDLIGLSSAEADPVTGDWREILQAVLDYSWNYSRVLIDTPVRSQLQTYKIHKQNFYGSTIDSYFTVKFLTDMGEPHVAPEP